MNAREGCTGQRHHVGFFWRKGFRRAGDPGKLVRPFQTDVHHHAAEQHAAEANPDSPPRPCGEPRRVDRVVRLKDRRKMRQVHDLLDRRLRRREAERTARALRARVPANERTNPRAVDARHAGEIDDEILMTAADELPQLAFECLRRAARKKRLARRQKQTVTDRLCLTRNGHEVF